MILTSAELRWFCHGEPPVETVAWFDREQANLEKRIDSYVVLKGADVVGVKIRSGRLEVKALTKGPREVTLLDNVMGQLEHWIKWSIDVNSGRGLEAAVRSSAPVVDVVKGRRLLKFASSQGRLQRVPVEQHIEIGCTAELTALVVSAHNWWTLGFEAFGDADVDDTLLSTARLVFVRGGLLGVDFRSITCQSYPSWLTALAKSKQL
jgi:hypothetical protein